MDTLEVLCQVQEVSVVVLIVNISGLKASLFIISDSICMI